MERGEVEECETYLWRKVVVVGDHSVGKTSLIKRFCEDKFSDKYYPTIGADYGTTRWHKRCTVSSKEVDVTFWDLAGGDEFKETRKYLYTEANVCIIVCDANNVSQSQLTEWTRETTSYGISEHITTVLVNKVDSYSEKTKGDLIQTINNLSSGMKIRFYMVSALTGEGVSDTFNTILTNSIGAA